MVVWYGQAAMDHRGTSPVPKDRSREREATVGTLIKLTLPLAHYVGDDKELIRG
jgi:hypothetical protein